MINKWGNDCYTVTMVPLPQETKGTSALLSHNIIRQILKHKSL